RFSKSWENVAQQICLSEKKCDDIYLLGTAVDDHQLSRQRMQVESVTKNAHAIELLAPLSEAFVKFLVTK
ncbi:MAG: hypothetical protein KC505_03475, partial [Myxococcales bacterium]|nr:hypothetical protein [Myxococcales bacterium]